MRALFGGFGGTPPSFEPDEEQLREGPANLFRENEAVGGWLWLTQRRLIFRAHQLNVQAQEQALPLHDIVRVEAVPTFWFIPNGMRVTLHDGQRFRFVVSQRGQWVRELRATCAIRESEG